MHNASVSTEPLTNTEAASQKRSLKSNGYLLAGAAIMLLLAAFALLAPVLAPSDPNAINPVQSLKSFNFEGHLLGTDNLGRDLLSRLLYGGRITLISSVVAALISTSLGTALGLIAAYYKGWIDVIVMRLTDILMGFRSFCWPF